MVRRFLACCSDDAKGQSTEIEIQYGDEMFHANGLIVLEKNYLEVYIYDKWESSQQLPNFRVGEVFVPTEANMFEGKTTAPNYLTEPELIGLMDANGIGTDATMAEHIAKIKEREYVAVHSRGSGRNAVKEFIPTRLGIPWWKAMTTWSPIYRINHLSANHFYVKRWSSVCVRSAQAPNRARRLFRRAWICTARSSFIPRDVSIC